MHNDLRILKNAVAVSEKLKVVWFLSPFQILFIQLFRTDFIMWAGSKIKILDLMPLKKIIQPTN